MLNIEHALKQILEAILPVSRCQNINLSDASGLILAEEINADFDVPSYDNSAMDGFAIASLPTSANTHYDLVGESLAGHPYVGSLQARQCIKIMTGAQLPNDARTVIPIEQASVGKDGSVTFPFPLKEGKNIRRKGEELQKGAQVYRQGHRLTALDIGMLASLGKDKVRVYEPIKIAIFSTGDELVPPGQSKRVDQLYDSNRFVLSAMLRQAGFQVINLGLIADSLDAISQVIEQASKKADAIICSGGVSVGDADYTKQALEERGEVGFWKVAMKPGKPFAFGKVNHAYFFGLPGNPVSAVVTFEKLVLPALLKLNGGEPETRHRTTAVAGEDLKKRPGRVDFQRGVVRNENGVNKVYSAGSQSSSMLTSLVKANCLICLPINAGNVASGEQVEVEMLSAPLKN